MKLTLTAQKKQTLENQHKSTRDGRVRDRIKAVLLCSEGWSTAKISQALRIHQTTIDSHLKDYEQSGKLKPSNGGSQSYLSQAQTKALIGHLCRHTYAHTHLIVAYVKECFGAEYTVTGMNQWLHHHNFSYKKPKGVPRKFEEARQQAFIQSYQQLKARCTEHESILFIDAVHPT